MHPGLNTFWTTLYRRVPDVSLCCDPPYHSIGWTSSLPATNSNTGPGVQLQEEEVPFPLMRNHCHLAPLASISLGLRNPWGRWGGGGYMENSSEDLGKENKLKKHLFLDKILADIWWGGGGGQGWHLLMAESTCSFLSVIVIVCLGIICDHIYAVIRCMQF